MIELPEIALSVRQAWAWAIVHGPKDIENRSVAAIANGNMTCRRIAIHASQGMTRDEYEFAAAFMARHGVQCPRPHELIRGAIIGAATVTAIVPASDSPWFFGPRGLVLTDKEACEPIPATGALGYFKWKESGQLLAPAKWMTTWPNDRPAASSAAKPLADLPLFGEGPA